MLKGSIDETSVTCPRQGSAHFCHRVDHFNLGWSGGRGGRRKRRERGEGEEEEEEEGGEEEEEERGKR